MAEIYYLEIGDYCLVAAEVLGTTPAQIARLPRILPSPSPHSQFRGWDSAITTPTRR
jgi:hypothetical protein